MTRARWSESARADLAAVDDYYRTIDPVYAYRLGRTAIAAGRFLADNPRAGPVLSGDVRKWLVGKTGYILIYRVIDDGIDIVRFRHGREDWQIEP